MADHERKKVLKLFVSMNQEKMWLEEMGTRGWKLKNVTLGCVYTFERTTPARLFYEVDRFNLPKNPTLQDIRHKEIFLEMAKEMGWEMIAHDEEMNYYFCKEYAEGDINELYNDEESRLFHAEKYRRHYLEKANSITGWALFIGIFLIPYHLLVQKVDWFYFFVFVYIVFSLVLSRMLNRVAKMYYREMKLTREEWQLENDRRYCRTARRLILTNRGLKKYLSKMVREGWQLIGITPLKYRFIRQEAIQYSYTLDSKYLTNRRCRAKGIGKFSDFKDWSGMNNDWQIQSVKDAEAKGWKFVCALENRAVIYRSEPDSAPEPLNDPKYDNKLRFISVIGYVGVITIISGLIGGVIGYILGSLGII
ncbi:DUF2812 domain-containing protein [Anaerolentibacter hominis]|uniref:DUF2812 domain-containing protein n=1 Tax=Anaerolentibacter hominis TaxID=3079009 RepID=UPI0031B8862B